LKCILLYSRESESSSSEGSEASNANFKIKNYILSKFANSAKFPPPPNGSNESGLLLWIPEVPELAELAENGSDAPQTSTPLQLFLLFLGGRGRGGGPAASFFGGSSGAGELEPPPKGSDDPKGSF